ncbi:glycerate kinase [Shewanella gelidii]|uniref:Glycerate kinase n=1 Tax=Shewanella gelidii TaxID=1642821 RepID=A0A917JKS8_9GAMM|nr:glycerate kinase [Shewanella gelidii]MCL1097025.1 glycerate kinase [Shewanella gelidii]GGI72011.1 glycerate kinase [Shewanella gelidii]
MKIVIAPDSFKESLTALEVANAIEAGFKQVLPFAEYHKVPMADGGEGTVQSLVDATAGTVIEKTVTGPLGEPVKGFYGLMGDGKTAVIEMAAASGLHYVPVAQRNPLHTTSYGTGELIKAALDSGVEHIIIGIGGSATNDAGNGMAQALGVRFLDANQSPIGPTGGDLKDLHHIDISGLDPRLAQVKLEVACDVDNPLCGPRGSSHIFGPQKGATPAMIEALDGYLSNYADIVEKQLGIAVKDIPGSGAAGGLGAALLGLFNATLRPGIEIVMDAMQLNQLVSDADIVITGEGRIDSQTVFGKTPIGVARAAKAFDIPVIGIAGCLAEDCHVVFEHGIDAVFSVIPRSVSLAEAIEDAAINIESTARSIAATLGLKFPN